LLPNGVAERAIVLGDDCPNALAPASSEQIPDGTPVDLVLLAPSRDQRRDPTWIQRAAQTVVSRLSPIGIAYIVPSRAIGLRRALAAGGLRSAGTLVHIPDLARSRHVVPVGTAAERYALSGQLPMGRSKRFAAALALRSPWLSTLGPTGTLLRRDPAIPLAGWLFELEGSPRPAGSVLATPSRTAAGGCVLHRFVDSEALPDAVAKVSPGAKAELHALSKIAPAAGQAGAQVPEVLGSGEIGGVPLVLQTALAGRSAALLIEGRQVAPADLQARLAAWLERWGRSSAQAQALRGEHLTQRVLSPAQKLAPLVTEYARYDEYLRALCSKAVDATCPSVPGHNDLTAANVLLDEGGDLAIVDWEEASTDSLPLMDLFYALVDAVAARESYADRPGAFASCFSAEGAHAPFVARLRSRLAQELGVDDIAQEVCFHACWLHHAANEAGRSAHSRAGPFVAILQMIAGDPERFRLVAPAR
jgi:phosphotransferase family enzyme